MNPEETSQQQLDARDRAGDDDKKAVLHDLDEDDEHSTATEQNGGKRRKSSRSKAEVTVIPVATSSSIAWDSSKERSSNAAAYVTPTSENILLGQPRKNLTKESLFTVQTRTPDRQTPQADQEQRGNNQQPPQERSSLTYKDQIENPSAYYRQLFGIYGDVRKKKHRKRAIICRALASLFGCKEPPMPPDDPGSDHEGEQEEVWTYPDFAERHPTDVEAFLALALGLVFLGFLILVFTGWVGLRRLFVNEDSYNFLCGALPYRSLHRYLYYLDFITCNRTIFRCDFQVCANHCPQVFWNATKELDLVPYRNHLFCAPDIPLEDPNLTHHNLTSFIAHGLCGSIYSPTEIVDNICYPSPVLTPHTPYSTIFAPKSEPVLLGMTTEQDAIHIAQAMVAANVRRGFDFTYTWAQMRQPLYRAMFNSLHSLWITIGFGILVHAGFMFYAEGFFLVLLVLGLLSQLTMSVALMSSSSDDFLFFDKRRWAATAQWFREGMADGVSVFSLTLGVFFIIWPFLSSTLAVCARRRVIFTLSLMQIASRNAFRIPGFWIVMVTFLLIRVLSYILGVVQVVSIFSAATKVGAINCTDPELPQFVEALGDLLLFSSNSNSYYCSERIKGMALVLAIMTIMLFWIWVWNFVAACFKMALAGAFTALYWAEEPKELTYGQVLKSIALLPRYHLGTAAVGAILLLPTTLLKRTISGIRHLLKNPTHFVGRLAYNACRCCFRCYDVAIRYKSSKAYIMTMMQGSSFCLSSRNAFQVMDANIEPWVKENLLLFRVTFVCMTAALTVSFFMSVSLVVHVTEENFKSWIMSGAFVAVVSMIILSSFGEVWNIGVKTLLVNYAVDLEENDGTETQPHKSTVKLMVLLDKERQRFFGEDTLFRPTQTNRQETIPRSPSMESMQSQIV